MLPFFKNKENTNREITLADVQLPEHIGFIMDGNGRWAKKRNLPRSAGHSAGAKTFRKIVKYCDRIGIKYVTVYAFSTENWKRPEDEVRSLMRLFKSYLEEAISDFKDEDIVVRFIGDTTAFSKDLQNLIEENERESADRKGMVLNIYSLGHRLSLPSLHFSSITGKCPCFFNISIACLKISFSNHKFLFLATSLT